MKETSHERVMNQLVANSQIGAVFNSVSKRKASMKLSMKDVELLETLCITPQCYNKRVLGWPTCSKCLHGLAKPGSDEAKSIKIAIEKAHAANEPIDYIYKTISSNPIYDNGYHDGYYYASFPGPSPYPKDSPEDKIWWEGWMAGDKQGHKDS